MNPELHLPPIEWMTEQSQSGFECPEAEQSGMTYHLHRRNFANISNWIERSSISSEFSNLSTIFTICQIEP
jgi:hypothetical protein